MVIAFSMAPFSSKLDSKLCNRASEHFPGFKFWRRGVYESCFSWQCKSHILFKKKTLFFRAVFGLQENRIQGTYFQYTSFPKYTQFFPLTICHNWVAHLYYRLIYMDTSLSPKAHSSLLVACIQWMLTNTCICVHIDTIIVSYRIVSLH